MAFKKMIIEVELLYDDAIIPHPDNLTLADIAYEFTNGSMSGVVRTKSIQTLTKKQVAKALIKQGSDPSFLLGE